MHAIIENKVIILKAETGADVKPDFEMLWGLLGENPGCVLTGDVPEGDDTAEHRMDAVLCGADVEWVDEDCDGIQRARYLGYICSVAKDFEGQWIAWAALIGACRVLDRWGQVTYETEAAAKADALRLAFEDTFDRVA